jgi:hypothetical protein
VDRVRSGVDGAIRAPARRSVIRTDRPAAGTSQASDPSSSKRMSEMNILLFNNSKVFHAYASRTTLWSVASSVTLWPERVGRPP